jgi:hypothetical protein
VAHHVNCYRVIHSGDFARNVSIAQVEIAQGEG